MLALLVLGACWIRAWTYLSEGGGAIATRQQPLRPNMLPELASICSSSKDDASGGKQEASQLQQTINELQSKLAAVELQRATLLQRTGSAGAVAPLPSEASGSAEEARALSWLHNSTAAPRLKHVWRMAPGTPGTRHALVEVHNSSWEFLSRRQLARGVATLGDPLRLQCLASKLLSGQAVKLSVVGGSVSFGTTFTTSKSKSLFHWKVPPATAVTHGPCRHPLDSCHRQHRPHPSGPLGTKPKPTAPFSRRCTSGSPPPSRWRSMSTTAAPCPPAGRRTWSTAYTGTSRTRTLCW